MAQNEWNVTRLIESAWDQPDRLSELEKLRRNLAVMFTDIKGSTAYFEKYGDAAGLAMVHHCNERLRKIVEEHGGFVVKTIGDAIMATFPDGPSSVRTAVEMQKSLATVNHGRPAEDQVFIRIAINYGPGIVRSNNDVFGDVVNVASRLASVAQPEQIIISGSLHELLAPLEDLQTAHVGRYHLKGKSGDSDVYEVLWTDKRSPLYALVHIRKDGSEGSACEIGSQPVIVGRNGGTMQFPADNNLAPAHAQFVFRDGQVEVEPLNSSADIYVQLLGPMSLRDGDQIVTGSQVFRFQMDPGNAQDSTGSPQLVLLRRETGQGQRAFPLTDCATWGRGIGTWTFPSDKIMSRSHAKVYRRGDDFFVEDLNSLNGTFLKVRGSSTVAPGSVVLMGAQRFQVKPR